MRRSLLTLALLTPTAVAFAQETAHHASVITLWEILRSPEFLAGVLNFLLLVTLLVVMGRKPLSKFLTERKRQVEEGLEQASALKAEAEKKLAEYTERLDQLDKEIAQMRADMVKAGETERDRIVAEAEKKAARMRSETRFLIEQRMKQVERDLRREAVDASVAAAKAVLEEKTTGGDRERLAQAYLEALGQTTTEEVHS